MGITSGVCAEPGGSGLFGVDYRRLNTISIRDTYPLPHIDDYFDSLGKANIFITLYDNCGY